MTPLMCDKSNNSCFTCKMLQGVQGTAAAGHRHTYALNVLMDGTQAQWDATGIMAGLMYIQRSNLSVIHDATGEPGSQVMGKCHGIAA
mmetsp:Transcript_22282/g.38110  ORF Transcript_22282/g.38110 Transcript_22282/m.38110 type:complete len:88 (-) Transcript_22282:717-980(-)|eukprot:CAMPEP_0119102106 /NCGR_PEP_ID=MMETSP1180-20130426/964_1 /TAXON_ID=3052 ORGANISM="Chlamydomonas cf sp, Strain CCMP681" /NCGR_SAMPLE_ID=MMETSP1180 /ASSEMBLY_ACC=CAM_ASM_000741 /LENGTH=87 /DNA_ID=CAMNT_0007086333 /DNA_START=711 /DNA_END=974 /DNA_ORIENTATION=-